jgi:hypothetical protein
MLWDLRCIEPDVAWLAARDSVRLWLALQNEEHRVEEEEAETRVKLKAMREHHKKWEGTRDKRINSWRDFASNKKAKKAKPLGGIKPPKLKVPVLSVAVRNCLLRDVAAGCCCAGALFFCKGCCMLRYSYLATATWHSFAAADGG